MAANLADRVGSMGGATGLDKVDSYNNSKSETTVTNDGGPAGTDPAIKSTLSAVAIGGVTSALAVISLDGSLAAITSTSPLSMSTIRPVAACAKLIYGSLGIPYHELAGRNH